MSSRSIYAKMAATPTRSSLDRAQAAMVAEQIEKMKRQYTDKFVVVDAARPELARFRDVVGQVKTVNMSGRALVEFLDYHLNTGWYDIDLAFLKVVDKPLPKSAKPKDEKPAAKAAVKPAVEKPAATAKPAAAPKAGKPSVADILAAARGGKQASGEATAVAAKAKADTKGKPEANQPTEAAKPAKPPAAAPAKVDRSKMSVADTIAAARAGGAPPAAAAPPQPAPSPAEEAAPPAAEVAVKAAPAKPAATPKSSEKVDKSKMSIDDMVAWCRQHDNK